MTQKEKDLLFKDLCARLPYGVKITWNEKHWVTVTPRMYSFICEEQEFTWKPYLRLMSSMTEEEYEEYKNYELQIKRAGIRFDTVIIEYFTWLNSHHFDFNRLIEKGLALEAPKNMYKI